MKLKIPFDFDQATYDLINTACGISANFLNFEDIKEDLIWRIDRCLEIMKNDFHSHLNDNSFIKEIDELTGDEKRDRICEI